MQFRKFLHDMLKAYRCRKRQTSHFLRIQILHKTHDRPGVPIYQEITFKNTRSHLPGTFSHLASGKYYLKEIIYNFMEKAVSHNDDLRELCEIVPALLQL